MKNNESLGNNRSEQDNSWAQVLGDHASNAIGSGTFQTIEDFRKEKAIRETYDPEREAWEKAHPHPEAKKEIEEELPRTALDYMREDLEELQYGPLEAYESEPASPEVTDIDKGEQDPKPQDISTPQYPVRPVAANPPQEPQQPVQLGPTQTPPEPTQTPQVAAPQTPQKPAEPSGDRKTFKSDHLEWPEETYEEALNRAMEQAETALSHANEALEEQKKQRAEKSKADKINEINRVIAEMAQSGDERLLEIMRKKDNESDKDRKKRLVMLAKTEIKWRRLKKSIEDARKHMEADNAALERIRASLTESRKIASTPHSDDTTPTEPSPRETTKPAPSSTIPSPKETTTSAPYKEKRIGNMILRVAPGYEDVFSYGLDGWKEPDVVDNNDNKYARHIYASSRKEQNDVQRESEDDNGNISEKVAEQKKILQRDLADRIRENLKKRGESAPQPEKKILNKDLKDAIRARIAEREASSSAKSESAPQPEKKILNKDLKDAIRARIAEREAPLLSFESQSYFSPENESLRHAEAVYTEYLHRVKRADDRLNAERDRLIKERSPSIRQKIDKIFSSLSQKLKERKENSRKKAEKRRREANKTWF